MVRRRIRVFKRLDAERGYQIEKEQGEEQEAALGAEEFRLMLGGGRGGEDRETALEDMFAAKPQKRGQPNQTPKGLCEVAAAG
jgi:hypothetical protein